MAHRSPKATQDHPGHLLFFLLLTPHPPPPAPAERVLSLKAV